MNYLAHLFLSEPSDERRIGSILADFTIGTIDDLKAKYTKDIASGIKHHRQIDRYTDTHPAVLHSVEALRKKYGVYSGIIVDVVFDHFLLKHWDRFSSEPEAHFMESIYQSLNRWDWDFPERYQKVIGHMVKTKWLDCYHDLDKVSYALKRIGDRFSRETPLGQAIEGVRDSYELIESDFLEFFPDLMDFSDSVVPH